MIGLGPEDLAKAGVRRLPRVVGTSGGLPRLDGGHVVEVVKTIVWCTGFVRDYSWIKLPIFDATGNPVHHRGVVGSEPGLYFVGIPFQSSLLSGLVPGAGHDAEHVVSRLVRGPWRGWPGQLSRSVSV